MELRELRQISKEMLANFINEIGLDGEYYASTCNCPMTWGTPKFWEAGEYITPESDRLKSVISLSKYDEKTQKILNRKGLILINKEYKNKERDSQLLITVMHETIHSNRSLLLFDAVRDGSNERAYVFNNQRYEQNTDNYASSYADASQEILKGSIDTSTRTVKEYNNVSSDDIEKIDFAEGIKDSQMEKQRIVDEALVDVMSYIAYKRYSLKQKNENEDIWTTIEKFKNKFKEAYDETLDEKEMAKSTICEIILKHHDFELFNWMLDPIEYSAGDIHYDFFADYTKNDGDLVKKLYGQEIDERDDTFITSLQGSVKSEPDSSEMVSNKGNSRQKTERSIDDDN